MLNFQDLTTYEKLRKEEERSRLLKTLNMSVHHEMLGPLKANVDISKRLVKQMTGPNERHMVQTIHIAS